MRNIIPLLLVLVFAGCPATCGEVVETVVESKAVKCGTDSVMRHQVALLGPVNDCLTGAAGGLTVCLWGLLDPTIGIVKDTVICLVRDRGADFSAMAQANTEDTVSSHAADNARKFIREQGVTFEE